MFADRKDADKLSPGDENYDPTLSKKKQNIIPSEETPDQNTDQLLGDDDDIVLSLAFRRMIPELGDPDREVSVAETFHEQTDDELTDKEVKQMEADDQAIQTILMGLLKDIYDVVDSCETAQEI
ncbi:hypothetical protein Tco_0898782 [Tanacetum coccineum]